MSFTSLTFLGAFLPATMVLYYAINNRTWRNTIALLASLFFYSLGRPALVLAMQAIALTSFFAGLLVARFKRSFASQCVVWAATLLILGVLVAVGHIVVPGLTLAPLYNLSFATPLLLTVFAMQAYSYIADVYRKTVPAEKNYFTILLGISFFPQMIVGPVMRYRDMYAQIKSRRETIPLFLSGFGGFGVGLIKFSLLAQYAGSTASFLLQENLLSLSASGAWLGIILFSCQIYFVFSGLSDMATGLAQMFGFEYGVNFYAPYAARSIAEFWSRWNSSLTAFFREYTIITSTTIKTIVVMSLVGLWHGFRLNLLLWGVYFAALLVFESRLLNVDANTAGIPVISTILTQLAVLFGWSMFFYENLSHLRLFLRSLLGLQGVNIALTVAEATAIHHIFWLLPLFALVCAPLPTSIGRLLKRKCRGFVYTVQTACLIAYLTMVSTLWGTVLPQKSSVSNPVFTMSSWLEGAYSTQVEEYLASHAQTRLDLDSQLVQVAKLISYDKLVYAAKIRAELGNTPLEEDSRHNFTQAPRQTTIGAGRITKVEIQPSILLEPVEEEQYIVAGKFLIFKNRAVQLFSYNSDSIANAWRTFNAVTGSLPESTRKYVLIAPMQICFEAPEHQKHSDSLKRAVKEVYANLSPDVTPVDAYTFMEQHSNEKLFMNTDYYWTALGAYYGAQAFADSAGVMLRNINDYEKRSVNPSVGAFEHLEHGSSLKAHPEPIEYYLHREISNTQLVYNYSDSGALVNYEAPAVALSRREYNIFLGSNHPFSIIKGDATNSRVLMIVGDSYRRAFAPWLIPSFEKIIVISPAHYNDGKLSIHKLLSEHKVTDFLIIECGRELSSTTLYRQLREIFIK